MINVATREPALRKNLMPIINAVFKLGDEDKKFVVSEIEFRKMCGFKTNKAMFDAIDETRRLGLIIYRRSYGALILRCLMGDNTIDQFEDYLNRHRTTKSGI